MMPPRIGTRFFKLSLAFGLVTSAGFNLHSELTWSPDGSPGGSGSWNTTDSNWTEDATPLAYVPGSDVNFPAPAGSVEINGTLEAGTVSFVEDGYFLVLENDTGTRLSVTDLQGSAQIGFSGLISAGADNYPDIERVRSTGLELRPTGNVRLETELVPVLGGSPVVGVVGNSGVVEFAGTWQANSGSIIPWLRLDDGGHFRVTSEAEMNFIKEGFFTLQLWVTGDGTGTLELEEGFIADRTEQGIEKKGIGSIRMGAGTLVSHHSANLPVGYRPRSDGTAQTNGHMTFENLNGTRWIVRTNDQVYPGAVWIAKSMEVVTETNLTHVGVTEGSSNYTAWNGWSLLNAVNVTKTGHGTLTLAGEQSYAQGAGIDVQEGTLVMQSDPAAGQRRGGGVTGAQLTLSIAEGARCEWQTSGALQSLFFNGELRVDGQLRIENSGFGQFGQSSQTEVLLSEDRSTPWIQSVGPVFAGGVVVVDRLPGYHPVAGSEWILCEAESVTGTWTLDDRTGLDLVLQVDGGTAKLVSQAEATGVPGTLVLEDDFDSPLSQWKDLSLVPRWGSPLANGTAFELTGSVVRLQQSGPRDTRNYTGYNSSNGLKTFTALDHQFGTVYDHATSEVTLDFRLRWPSPSDDQGEAGRLMFLFNHDYPEGGLDLTPEGQAGSRYNDFSQDWWARPAYHVRLRGSTSRSGSTFLQYGGGPEVEGEYEATNNWWLPGFVSGAGGLSPGAGDDFPENSWTRTQEGMARNTMTSYRYRILPDRQELWRDDNDDGFLDEDELKAVMPLPLESDAPFYKYFEHFEGLRIFWNGRGTEAQVEIDWVRLIIHENLSPVADAGPEVFAQILVEDRAPVMLDASGSSDFENDPLLYVWMLDGEILASSKLPVTHVALGEGIHPVELLLIDANGNFSYDTVTVNVTLGQARPVADAGNPINIVAENDYFGIVNLSATGSFSPNGELVRYRWSVGTDDRILSDSAGPLATVALGIGIQQVKLTVWDEEDLFTETTVRVAVDSPGSAEPVQVLYRENFSRTPTGGEKGPWEVGWDLMRFDGEPVPSVAYDGNAHRSLSHGSNPVYLERVNADPTGTEYDSNQNLGHMWMNQMPFKNATPSEWMLWTDEYVIDREAWDLKELTFHSTDSSPERVKVAPAFRIDGQWYIGWDLRVETPRSSSYWRFNTIDLAPTGWYLFEPSQIFTITRANAIDRLPEGNVTAFGIYMYKDYGWYVNRIDNFTILGIPKAEENPYNDWVASEFPQSVLVSGAPVSTYDPDNDPDANGWVNLFEYAMGLSPFSTELQEGPYLDLQDTEWVYDMPWNPDATNVETILFESSDLLNWTPVPAVGESYTGETGQTRRMWRMGTSNETGDPRFFHMRARLAGDPN